MSHLALIFWVVFQQAAPAPAGQWTPKRPTAPMELLQAAQKGEVEKIRGLSRHPGFGGTDSEGRTSLLIAGESGQKTAFGEIIGIVNARAKNVAVRLPRDGQDAVLELMNAVDSRTFLFNAADKKGMTPLMYAARQGWNDLVLQLLNGGAKSTSLDTDGLSAADYADKAGHPDLADTLREVK
jgi:uncharacterized protein